MSSPIDVLALIVNASLSHLMLTLTDVLPLHSPGQSLAHKPSGSRLQSASKLACSQLRSAAVPSPEIDELAFGLDPRDSRWH